jgi:hypothetical protein
MVISLPLDEFDRIPEGVVPNCERSNSVQKTQVRHEALIRQLAAEDHLTRRQAKQAVRRLGSRGDVTVSDGEIVVGVSASELWK